MLCHPRQDAGSHGVHVRSVVRVELGAAQPFGGQLLYGGSDPVQRLGTGVLQYGDALVEKHLRGAG